MIRRSCQEVRHVNYADCSVYRTTEPRSIYTHGLNVHYNFLQHKDSLTGIIHQLLRRQGGP